MIIDTHAHYDDEQFDEDRGEILGKMQDAGIGMIMDAGSTILSWDKIVKLTEEYPFVYGAIGVHPDEVGNLDETQFARMERLLDKEKIKRSEKSVWIIIGIRKIMIFKKNGLSDSSILREKKRNRSLSTAGRLPQIRWRL